MRDQTTSRGQSHKPKRSQDRSDDTQGLRSAAWLRLLVDVAAVLLLGLSPTTRAAANPGIEPSGVGDLPKPASWPLDGPPPVLRGFDPPADRYGAGHRGVDLGGFIGSPVLASAAGTISFAGRVGSMDAVTVNHGAVRTTYSPVRASLPVGSRVDLGQRIGTLEAGHCPEATGRQACLHWGLIRGEVYLDPLLLAPEDSTGSYRLVAASERAAVLARRRAAEAVAASYGLGPSALTGAGYSSSGARTAVAFAYRQLGKPYVFGAAGPNAFDCSGLTMRAWEAAGVPIGHYTGVQWTKVEHITMSQLRPGDLVFWGSSANPSSIYHTAIYIGQDKIIEAPRPGKNVEISGMHDWILPNFFGRAPSR